MVLFNYATKELTAKVVYYGPGLCGKTTNLQFVHQNLPDTVKGKMLSLATKTDRTLFFDFLPLDLGEIRGMKTRVQLYTVPGQVFYNETRKLVLKGVDGLVFVADSQKDMLQPNIESFSNLEENLKGHGLSLAELPHVIQFNKRDLPKLASVEEINAAVNKYNAPFYESVATTGIGVKDTLNAITKLVLVNLTTKYGSSKSATPEATPVLETPAAAAAEPQPQPAVAVTVPEPEAAPPAVAVASSPEPTVSVGSADAFPPAVPVASFADAEIDELMAEAASDESLPPVDEAPQPAAAEPMPAPAAAVARVAAPDPDEVAVVAGMPVEPVVASPVAPEMAPAELTLTEAASDDDLFNDPNLEIARLTSGEMREIVVPIEIGDDPETTRRFRLSFKLRLDPVD